MSTTNPFEVTTPELPFASEHQRWRLKRVGVFSMAIFSGAIMAAMGLLGSLVMLGSFAFSANIGGGAGGPEFLGGGVIAVMIPFMYGIMGLISGAVGAVIYNIIAGMTGGIEMEFAPNT